MKGLIQYKLVITVVFLLLSQLAWSQTDFRLSVSPPGNPIVFPTGGTVETLTYTIENLGPNDETDLTTVIFNLDPNIEPASGFSTDPNWNCFPITGQVQCDYFNNYPLSQITTIELSITPPQFDMMISNAVQATLSNASGDPNQGDNTINTAIDFIAPGSVDLAVTKILSPGSPTAYAPGDPISFEITASHISGPDATNVVVMDDLLVNNLQFDAANSTPDCNDFGSFVECNATVIPAGGSVVFTVAATVSPSAQPGNFTNTANISAAEPDPVTINNSDGADFSVVVGGGPEVAVTKNIIGGMTQIVQGTSFEYDIQVNNTGIGNAVNVDLADTLPPEVTYISHTNLGNFVCTFTAPNMTCNAANLPNTTAQDGVRILVSADGTIGSNVNNTASSAFADSNSLDNSDSIAFSIIAPDADLDLTMVSDAPNYTVGDLVTLNLTLHNPFASTGAPPNTTVVTTLPNEVIFNSAQVTNVPGWTCVHDGSTTGGAVTCSSMGNPVAIGTNTFIDIVAVADGVATTVSPFATVTSDFDPNPSNDTTNTAFEIFPGDADLSIQFLSTSGVYNQGDSIIYDIRVDNPVGSTANPSDTRIDIIFPAEVSYINLDLTAAPGWFCTHDGSPSGGAMVCDRQGAAFNAASTHDFKFLTTTVTPATAAIIQTTISSAADTVLTNNSATQSDVINAVSSDFSIGKTVNVTDATIGDPFTYVLTVTNDPSSTADPTDVVIVDTLPAEVSYDSFIVGTNLGTTINCTHDGSVTGGVFTCDTNTNPFPIGEVVTVDINVTAAAVNPNVVNTATVQTTTDPDGIANNNVGSSGAVNISVPATTTLSVLKDALAGGVAVTEVAYGQQYDYVLTVTNTGVNDATDVHVSDNLPPQVTLVGFDTTGWTCLPLNTNAINQVVDCNLDTVLAAGNSVSIVLNVTATNDATQTSITNQMSAQASNATPLVSDTNIVNLLSSMAGLTVSQTPSPVDPGGQVSFDVVYTNTGTTPLTGVQLDATLPTGFVYDGFSGDPGLSCAQSAGTVNCTYANPLPVSGNITLTLSLTTPSILTNPQYILQVSGDAIELTNPVNASFNTVFPFGDFALSMISNPIQANPGMIFNHEAKISNTGSTNINLLKTFFTIPAGAELVNVQSADMNCTTTATAVNCINTQVMAPGAQIGAVYALRSDGLSNVVSTTLNANADGNVKTTGATTQIVASNFADDLALTKSTSVSQVGQREAFSYHFDVLNNGNNDQTSFTLTDQLPDDVLLQSFTGESWSCTGENMISCQFSGALSPGTSTQLTFEVIAPATTGIISNTAQIAAQNDDNPTNNQSTANVQITTGNVGVGLADLGIELSVETAELTNTEQVNWNLNITNYGPDTANSIQIENMFPLGFSATEVVVANDVSCVLLTDSLICNIDSLAVNQSRTIELQGGFDAGFVGLMINQVEVTSTTPDPHISNNTSTSEVNVLDSENLIADMALEIQAEVQDIRQGQTFEMTIVTSNNGPDNAFESMLNTEIGGLISQLQVVNAGQWMCQTSNQTLTCQFPGAYPNGLTQNIDLLVSTQEVVQVSEPIQITSIIESAATDPNPGNNMSTFSNNVTRTPSEDEIFSLFEDAVGGGASDTVLNTIRSVSSYCARSYFMALEGLCEDMIASARPDNREAIINAMEEMTPNEVIGQATSAAEIMTSQFRNVSTRLSQLRGGGGSGVSVAGLTARYGNESLPLGLLAYLNQSEDEASGVSNINDFVSPWGFFVNGNISMGERDATGRELGFDFDTYGLTAGMDYRFSPTKVAGVALGYANFDSEIEDEAEMKSTGFTLTGYGSFYVKDNFYVDGRISYGNPDFEQKRRINFELDNIAIDRIATGKTDADQYTIAMSMGYHFNKNSWNITPNASFTYTRTTIDDFVETGAGAFNFRFGEQEVKSMVWSLGTSVSKAISLKNGVLSPQFDINISREMENDGGFIEARFINAPDDEIFLLQTDEPDRTYGSAGLGLVFIGANGKQAYINYKSIFGLDGFTRGTINLGARFEF